MWVCVLCLIFALEQTELWLGLILILGLISGVRREIDEICALLGCYAEYSGDSLRTFRSNLSGPILCLKMGPLGCSETSARNCH